MGALLLRRKVGEIVCMEDAEIECMLIEKRKNRVGVRYRDANGHKDHWIYLDKPLTIEEVTIQLGELQWDRGQLRITAPKDIKLVRKELLAARY